MQTMISLLVGTVLSLDAAGIFVEEYPAQWEPDIQPATSFVSHVAVEDESDAPSTPGPPLPDTSVLEISDSPEPAVNLEIVFPAPPLGAGDTDGEDNHMQVDRGSSFTVPDQHDVGIGPPVIVLPEQGQVAGTAELTDAELNDTAGLVYEMPSSEPGQFVPYPSRPKEVGEMVLVDLGEPVEETSGVSSDVEQATYGEILTTLKSPKKVAAPEASLPPARPWTPLVLTVIALLASLGGNAYLGYLFVGLYGRYKRMANSVMK